MLVSRCLSLIDGVNLRYVTSCDIFLWPLSDKQRKSLFALGQKTAAENGEIFSFASSCCLPRACHRFSTGEQEHLGNKLSRLGYITNYVLRALLRTIGCITSRLFKREFSRGALSNPHLTFRSSDRTSMDDRENAKRSRGAFARFAGEYWALLTKMFLLTKRKRGQTIVEFLLAYIFLALLLALRSLLDRQYIAPMQLDAFHPYEKMLLNSTPANMTYYYPGRDPIVLRWSTDLCRSR